MLKRILALSLALLMLVCCLTACSHGELDKGAYIRMYLDEPIYDFDPLAAFDNESSLQVVSLLFDGLFSADENGKPKKMLVDSYKYIKDKEKETYTMQLTLNETYWSDGVLLTATHAQFAFRRLFYSDVSHPATALLYDVKNARDIAAGKQSVDHLAVSVIDNKTLEIEFERDIDVDAFLVTLCSPALYPLRDDIVDANPNWAKSRTSLVCSGPFLVRSMDYDKKDGFILERNAYYYRDRQKDKLDKSVKPFRIVVDYTAKAEDVLANFNTDAAGALYYIGHIPLSVRKSDAYASLLKKVKVSDAPSTHVYYLNENAEIGGKTLFADAAVRKALSLAVDRNAIAEALVYARAADGLVPYTVRNRADKSKQFRKKAESYIAATANVDEAKSLLSSAGVTPSAYSFSISVAAYDEDHIAAAELVATAWKALGFKVTVEKLNAVSGENDLSYRETLQSGAFEVIALDLVATSPDAFGYLAPFATAFSGNALDYTVTSEDTDGAMTPHVTGYTSAAYAAKIEEAFATVKPAKRAKLLHEAEAMLMEDMPVIPIVYNQNVSLKSSKLSGVSSSFYCRGYFAKTKLAGYWKVALRDEFITQEELDKLAEKEAD